MIPPYTLVRTQRRTCAIQIRKNGNVVVRAPKKMPLEAIEAFINQKTAWIVTAQEKMRMQEQCIKTAPPLTEKDILVLTEQARRELPTRVRILAAKMGVTYSRVSVRHQKTLFGSCNAKGDLSFNCLVMLAPSEVIDYLVVHELCHRVEMNHSRAFWALVGQILPNYRESRQWLRQNGTLLIRRMESYKK